jgi:phospholipid/cholesterol/gamma-HCH transport system ATP-binding protein
MTREETAVEVKHLRKSFGGRSVLAGINLKVSYDETLTVLGQSGTGKSVLLKLIVGLQAPDSGSITIDGRDIHQASASELVEVRKSMGFLFQQAALYDSLSVEANVGFPLKRHSPMSTSERNERVAQLLQQVGMEEHAHKMPSQISGGMQKRVALARALALEPRILLFDEPTTGLDPITSSEIDELILQVQKRYGTASIVVTHDLHSARNISDRMVLIHEGKTIIEGPFDDLQNSQDEFVSRFMRQAA